MEFGKIVESLVLEEPLEPLAGSSTDAPNEPLEPLAGSSTDAPNESVDENANAALAMVGKVVSLLQRAQARNKLASALEFLRQRVGLNLPSLGGEMLTQEALDEAEKQMSTEAD